MEAVNSYSLFEEPLKKISNLTDEVLTDIISGVDVAICDDTSKGELYSILVERRDAMDRHVRQLFHENCFPSTLILPAK